MKLFHKRSKTLEYDDIISNLLIVLVVGYDTTGLTLSYLAYAMSKNPGIQEKLQQEIDQAYDESDDDFLDYNTIQHLPYLDMVIHETLRYQSK